MPKNIEIYNTLGTSFNR